MKHNYFKITIFLFVILIIALAIIARFWRLDQVVTTLNRDEAALAYNAYLLKMVGVDEWGVRWPLILRSFGDWKLVGYPTLLVALFSFLPATDWLVRLPSALAGSALVILSYFFARKVFTWPKEVSLFFSLLVATSPFAIFYSRFAYEANAALFYLVLTIFLWWQKTTSHKQRLVLDLFASLLLFVAIFTYNTPFLLLPFLIGFILLARDLRIWQQWLPAAGSTLFVGLFSWWKLAPVLAEKSGITIFTDQTIFQQFVRFRQNLPQGLIGKLIANHYVYDLLLILKNVWASFSLNSLVLAPHHPWHAVPGTGQVYGVVYLLGLVSLLFLLWRIWRSAWQFFQAQKQLKLKQKLFFYFTNLLLKPAKKRFLLIYLILISLAPASVTVDAPHATRSLLFLWLWLLVVAYFVNWLVTKLRSKLKKWLILILCLTLTVAFANYLPKLFFQYHQNQVSLYHSGFQEKLLMIEKKYPHQAVAIVDPDGYQYILLAWYLKLKPAYYLTHNIRQLPNQIDFRYGQQVGDYHFIVQVKDRASQEKIVLFWDRNKQDWQIKQF